MTVTALTGPGRVSQFLWGPNQQNTLTFGYPLALDNARFWRASRVGSEQVLFADRFESWTVGRDYFAHVQLRWIPLYLWCGGAGVQAFLDWGANANPFTFIPDAVNSPLFGLPGCLLTQPFDTVDPQPEVDGSQAIEIQFRNPTYDIGLAWR